MKTTINAGSAFAKFNTFTYSHTHTVMAHTCATHVAAQRIAIDATTTCLKPSVYVSVVNKTHTTHAII